MELTGLILGAAGAVDLSRRIGNGALQLVLGLGALGVISWIGAAVAADPTAAIVLALVPAAIGVLWWATIGNSRGAWAIVAPVAVLVGVATDVFVVDLAPTQAAMRVGTLVLSGATAVTIAGGALFLCEASNTLVRLALRPERIIPTSSDEPHPLRHRRLPRRGFASWRRRGEVVTQTETGSPPASSLRGGRIIGPIERLALAALVLAQAYPVVAAVVAAKGIVRFPEISRDRDHGTQAEYFLVGSMISWSLSFAVAGLIWLTVPH